METRRKITDGARKITFNMNTNLHFRALTWVIGGSF